MDKQLLEKVLEDFDVYCSMIRQMGAPSGLSITGGCYEADRFGWSRVKGVRVHFDQQFAPRKIEHLDLGVTYRIER